MATIPHGGVQVAGDIFSYECVTRSCCASVGVIQTAHRVKITKFLVDFCR